MQDPRDTVLNKTDLLPTGTISPLNEFGSQVQDELHPKILTGLHGKTTEPLITGREM